MDRFGRVHIRARRLVSLEEERNKEEIFFILEFLVNRGGRPGRRGKTDPLNLGTATYKRSFLPAFIIIGDFPS